MYVYAQKLKKKIVLNHFLNDHFLWSYEYVKQVEINNHVWLSNSVLTLINKNLKQYYPAI